MDEVLSKLIALHDLDQLLKELENPEYQELGFEVKETRKKELLKRREELVQQIPEQVYRRYERLRKRYGRGIAPVVGGVCMNCFIQLPTAVVSGPDKNQRLETCSNCGIFIYLA